MKSKIEIKNRIEELESAYRNYMPSVWSEFDFANSLGLLRAKIDILKWVLDENENESGNKHK